MGEGVERMRGREGAQGGGGGREDEGEGGGAGWGRGVERMREGGGERHSTQHFVVHRCTVGYEMNDPKRPLIVLEQGMELEEFTKQFNAPDLVQYGLVRVVSPCASGESVCEW